MQDKVKITKKSKKPSSKPEAYDDKKIKNLVDQFSRKSSEAYDIDKKYIEGEYSRSLDPFNDDDVDINNNNVSLSNKAAETESNLSMLKRKYGKHKRDTNLDMNNNNLTNNNKSKDSSNNNQNKRKYSRKPSPQKPLDFSKMTERITNLEQKVSKLQVFCAFQLSNLKYSSNFVNSFENIFSTDMKPEHTFPFGKQEDLTDDDLTLKCEEDDMPTKPDKDIENDFEVKPSKFKVKEDNKYADAFSWPTSPEKRQVKKFGLDDPLDEGADSDNESNLSEKAMDIVKDLCKEMESDNSMSPIKISFNPEEDNQLGDFNDETEANKNNNPKKPSKKRIRKPPKPKTIDPFEDEGIASKEDGLSESNLDAFDETAKAILNGEIPGCPKCDYKPVAKSVAGIKQSLKQHNKAVHDKVKDKQCAYCEYKTSHKSNLNTHTKNKHKKDV